MGLTVNGVEIQSEQVGAEMDRLREDYVAYVRENGGEAGEEQLREWAEENLIESELLRQEAVATQAAPTDARALQNIKDCPEYYEALPEEERLSKSKEALQVKAFERALRKRVPAVGEDEARREYEAHPELFAISETLRLSHICRLVGPGGLPRNEAYLELLRMKADLASRELNWFDALQASDTYGHDFGMFAAVAQGDLPPEVEKQVFALEIGSVSDVIELDGRSLHLFRLLAKDPPGKAGFQDVKDRLRSILFERAYQEALEQVFDALKSKAVIRREA